MKSGNRNMPCGVGAIMLAALVIGGCTVGPDYTPPQTPMPESFSSDPGSATTRPTTQPVAVDRWWTTFNDPRLDRLVADAIGANLDLRLAEARIREARAARGIVSADRWPTVNSGGTLRRSRSSENIGFETDQFSGAAAGAPAGSVPDFGIGQARDLWQLGLDARWELDLFGRVRRSVEAADADIAATAEWRNGVLVSLQAEVALNYIELRGAQAELAITRKNLASQEDTAELMRVRQRAGLTGELDVVRAEAQVATTAALVPGQEARIRRAIHRLGVLTGRQPAALTEELLKDAPLPPSPAAVPVGLPSDLLRRRPDIRRAERQLAAATARIGVATAELFPRFSLTGGAGLQSDRGGNLASWESRYWSIAPGITWPIFDAGRIRAQVRVQNARQEQALVQYEQAVLAALEDVENAIVAYAADQRRRASLARAVQSNARAVELARDLHARGLVDFLNVLEAQRALLVAEDALVRAEASLAGDLIALFKAMGGGWEVEDAAAR